MHPDPFSPDIPRDKYRERAASRYRRLVAANPGCDRAAVVRALEHWLAVQAHLAAVAARIRESNRATAKLTSEAIAHGQREHLQIESAIAAACQSN